MKLNQTISEKVQLLHEPKMLNLLKNISDTEVIIIKGKCHITQVPTLIIQKWELVKLWFLVNALPLVQIYSYFKIKEFVFLRTSSS